MSRPRSLRGQARRCTNEALDRNPARQSSHASSGRSPDRPSQQIAETPMWPTTSGRTARPQPTNNDCGRSWVLHSCAFPCHFCKISAEPVGEDELISIDILEDCHCSPNLGLGFGGKLDAFRFQYFGSRKYVVTPKCQGLKGANAILMAFRREQSQP